MDVCPSGKELIAPDSQDGPSPRTTQIYLSLRPFDPISSSLTAVHPLSEVEHLTDEEIRGSYRTRKGVKIHILIALIYSPQRDEAKRQQREKRLCRFLSGVSGRSPTAQQRSEHIACWTTTPSHSEARDIIHSKKGPLLPAHKIRLATKHAFVALMVGDLLLRR